MTELTPGELLNGRYRIDRVIGEGAMGAVYLARDERLGGASWALKVLDESDLAPAERAEAVGLFRREADISARLRHPGLPEVVDFFTEGDRHVLVMKRVPGETLASIAERRGRPMDESELLPLLVQLCACLIHLHEQTPHPIVFRDLKPSNCMVTPEGKLTLIDFGIARYHKPGRKSDTLVIGTPGFCAPEQYGQGQTDPRSDLYALGAMTWHLLSGLDPAAVGFQFPPLRQVAPHTSEALEAIVARCVSFAPAGRYPSARELLADLRWALANGGARPASVGAPARTAGTRRTRSLSRTSNRRLAASPPPLAATSAAVFVPVRPSPTPSPAASQALDSAFLAAWARRTFRVWWGAGSVSALRILGVLLATSVLVAGVRIASEAARPAPVSSSAIPVVTRSAARGGVRAPLDAQTQRITFVGRTR